MASNSALEKYVEAVSESKAGGRAPDRELMGKLISFFYPVHYRVGMDLESVMCQGRISRKQAAILWLVHAGADKNGWIRRKEIEERLTTWFEISNSNISKLLRELTKSPLSLLSQVENPLSGREKVVRLTREGEIFVGSMFESSIDYLQQTFSHLSAQDAEQGLNFFKLLFQQSDSNL